MEPDLSEFKDFDLIRKAIVANKATDEMLQFFCPNSAKLLEMNLPIESYTFRGKDSIYWFNITFVEGRIIITGDSGDNVFIVGGSNTELKNWLINLDIDYALGKSKQGREYYDREYAENCIKDRLREAHDEDETKAIMEQLDFSHHILLQNSMCTANDILKIFPDYWELNLYVWSPMQKMQYKQLVFAGKWLKQTGN